MGILQMNKTKLIFSPQLAQWLLQNGFTIVDLKPKRGAEKETVFVFEVKSGFNTCVQAWLGERYLDEDNDY